MTAHETPVQHTADVEQAVEPQDGPPMDPVTDTSESGPASGRLKRIAGRIENRVARRVLATVLALLVVASLALFGALFDVTYLADRDTDGASAKAAVSAASDGTVAVLSYSPETLERDFSSAKSRLTGDFLSYYDQFTEQIVAPAAKRKSVKTTAVVLRAALSKLRRDGADVLLFVNQSTQSADRPEPTLTSSSVLVTLAKADGKWLISSFTPV